MIVDVIQHLVPSAELVLRGNDPTNAVEYAERIEWLDHRSQPSWTQIEAAAPQVMAAQRAARIQAQRHAAYIAEADPLYFAWQRGETTEQAWRDKVTEIRNRYPYA